MDTLTPEQRNVFDIIESGKNVFVTGSGGTGKSYLIHSLYNELPKRMLQDTGLGVRVSVTALTGCAAILLGCHAKTIHSWSGIGLGKGSVEELVYKINRNGRAKKNWKCTNVLIIDEISMMTPELLEKLDMIGRIVRRNRSKPFGGIQVVLIGDFLQLPPVTKGEDIKFAFESEKWNEIIHEVVELTYIHRQQDNAFRNILEESRFGSLSPESIRILESRMHLNWKTNRIRPTLLFPRRAEVNLINESNLNALTGVRYSYKASTVIGPEHNAGFNQKHEAFKQYVAMFDREATYEPELILAEGAQVMLLTNLDIDKKLVNGSRGVVVGFKEDTIHTPIVEFLCGLTMPISNAVWELEDYPHVFRSQIPLKLAYAVTTHKSQGATLDCALIDIGSNIFEFGQAYVALSRVRSLDSLYIHDFEPEAIFAHPRVIEFYKGLRRTNEVVDPSLLEDQVDPSADPVDSLEENWLFASVPESWKSVLRPRHKVIDKLSEFLTDKVFLPKKEKIWNALSHVSPDQVRVVILGQDPYPTAGHAMGLAFSIEKDIRPLPGSLRNIFKELQSDLGILRTDGCLEDWSKQGVLLLNTVLTVEEGKPQSHAKIGWEDVTDEILSSLCKKGILFVLWGKSAQNKTKLLNGERILMAAHPSPLSAHNGFYGSKPFSSINTYLEEKGLPKITWG
jgi:uracil-DNA glycosylase